VADDIQLLPGGGGSTVRSLTESNGRTWPVGVSVYAANVAEDANVLQVVTPDHGLPVAQQGLWETSLAAGTTVVATQSDPSLLKVTASIAAGQSVGVSGSVTVAQGTASNLKALVDISSGQTVGISGSVTVAQATASNLMASAVQSGTWNIGTVTTLTSITNPVGATQSGTWTVGISAGQSIAVTQATASNLKATVDISSGQAVGLSAGTNLVGKVVAGSDTGVVYFNGTACTLKRAFVSATSSGDTTVVAAVTGKSLYVLRYSLRGNSTVNVKFRSNSTDISALFYLLQYAVNNGAATEFPHYATASGEALKVNLSAAGTVSVEVLYIEV
jgi:hypothetical protein